MPKKSVDNESKIIDLLEKNLIVQLYANGAKRDEIKKIMGIGSDKISLITKFIKNKKDENHE